MSVVSSNAQILLVVAYGLTSHANALSALRSYSRSLIWRVPTLNFLFLVLCNCLNTFGAHSCPFVRFGGWNVQIKLDPSAGDGVTQLVHPSVTCTYQTVEVCQPLTSPGAL
ncbi:uncharacterized protein EI90DRAFT_3070174 [Cantharellus anzutake]|uniref:uncharacterized protein n=1 Tax=Cantharellus anzutake TaxID=1750568 RepID=UPI001905BC62|nr:uncharacterized protein EI90DRAFT_3070174 [Cantharellus anzutake]KAF8326687.1 hypothetical protein EI90DRAFT_3070174 [Cantharellus anzutake]